MSDMPSCEQRVLWAVLGLGSRAPERSRGESGGGSHHCGTEGMAEGLQAREIPREGKRAGTGVRASSTLRARGWEEQRQCQNGTEGGKP